MGRRWTAAALVAITAAVLLTWATASAQQNSVGRANALAVEIVNGDLPHVQFPVSAGPDWGFAETSPSNPLPDWKQPAGARSLARIRIRTLAEGDAVRIKVFAVFDDSYPIDAPGPKYGAKEEPLTSYLAREGETVSVGELKSFGFEPLLLKVVRERPTPDEQPLPFTPEIVSRLKSVEVIAFANVPAFPNDYRLSLRNLSTKNITALAIYETEHGDRNGSSQMSSRFLPGRPLIAAGAVEETILSAGGRRCRFTPEGCIPDPPTQLTYVIGTVVFEDGTYEGEARVATGIEARRAGRQAQLARIMPLLKEAMSAPDEDEAATLEKLKGQVSSLRIDVEPAIIDELLGRYPSLSSAEEKRRLTESVMEGLKGGREEVINGLKDFEKSRGKELLTLKTWLSRRMEKYEPTPSK